MMIMSKTDVNRLLNEITLENDEYGLIFKLEYIYGRNISDVLELKVSDVDLARNVIKFRLSKSNLTVPIVKDIESSLITLMNNLNDGDYLFLNEDNEYSVGILTKRLNYYLNGKIGKMNKGSDYKIAKITNRDLKNLRGQHLYYDNVPIEMVHELYNNFNYNETKNSIDYESIKEEMGYDNLNNLLENYTDLNIFEDKNYVGNEIFMVMDRDDNYCVVEFVEDGLIIHEESKVSDRLSEYNVTEIYEEIKNLNVGEYKFVKGLKFLR